MNSSLPANFQIKQVIKSRIINRDYKPGERIPTHEQLADEFKVTRLTVRQALLDLSQEGLLISTRGRGTFVTEDKDVINTFSIESIGFIDENLIGDEKPQTKTATISKTSPEKSVIEKLDLDSGVTEVIQIERVRYLRNNPFNYIKNYLSVEVGSKIDLKDLYEKSLLEILEKDIGIEFCTTFQSIQATFVEYSVAKHLHIQVGSPVLFVERIIYTLKRKPFLLSRILFRGDLFKYIARYKKVKKGGAKIWVRDPI